MTVKISPVILALALCTGAAPAGAQTSTAGRPLQLVQTQQRQTTIERTTVREVVMPQKRTTKQSAKRSPPQKKIVRTVTRERILARPAMRAKIVREKIVTRPIVREKFVTRPIIRETVGMAPVSAPLALTPSQRSMIYRTIVEEPLQAAPVITQRIAPAPLVTAPAPIVTAPATIVTAPAPMIGERVVLAPAPVSPNFPAAGPVIQEVGARTLVVDVGSQLPATVPLYVLPSSALTTIPQIERFRYAIVDDRIYLVDPVSGIIVATLDE